MFSAAHQFGRFKFQIFDVKQWKKSKQMCSKFKIRHVQIDELPRTLGRWSPKFVFNFQKWIGKLYSIY